MLNRMILLIFILAPISSFSIIGEENVLLFELVSTTIKELNELERLVTNAEKYTQKIREYNELMEDHLFRAERIQYIMEDLVAKREIENLSDFNSMIRNLKYSISDLKYLIKEYQEIQVEDERVARVIEIKKGLLQKKERRAKKQVEKSINARNNGRANQITAQNTALIYEGQVEMQNVQLELLKSSSIRNKLLAQELEEKKKREIQKRISYGLDRYEEQSR